jgi:ubiquitin-conjugating enzyme E2 D
MLEEEAEQPTPGSPPSSPESSPIMTPETSDDEDEDEFHLSEAGYESPDEREPLLDTPTATPERLCDEGKDLLHTSAAIFGKPSNEGEDLSVSPEVADLDDEGRNPFSTPGAVLESSEDENEDIHYAPMASELYYGVLLSSIRKADRAALESINLASAREQSRSRMRVHRELKSVHEDETIPYLSVAPINGDLGNCLASLEGAPDTPWEGGIFWLHIDYPEDYPLKPPAITFLTPVYHPNIDENGRICIDILEKSWSPCLQTQTLLLSILSVLHSPIVDDGAIVTQAADKYLLDNDDYCDIVRIYTASASGVRPDTSNLVKLTAVDSS